MMRKDRPSNCVDHPRPTGCLLVKPKTMKISSLLKESPTTMTVIIDGRKYRIQKDIPITAEEAIDGIPIALEADSLEEIVSNLGFYDCAIKQA
jgi:hypothetical protein